MPGVVGSGQVDTASAEAPQIARPVGLHVMLADTNYFSSEAHSGHSGILSCCFY